MASRWGSAWLMGVGQLGKGGWAAQLLNRPAWLTEVGQHG